MLLLSLLRRYNLYNIKVKQRCNADDKLPLCTHCLSMSLQEHMVERRPAVQQRLLSTDLVQGFCKLQAPPNCLFYSVATLGLHLLALHTKGGFRYE